MGGLTEEAGKCGGREKGEGEGERRREKEGEGEKEGEEAKQ